jgi:anti-sigma factor RsiW
MNCEEAQELVQLYLDDELDARSTLGVQKHLETCPACERLLEALLQQDQLLKAAARAEAVDSGRVRAGILAALNHQPQPSQTPARWWILPSWQRLAAAVVLVAAATLFAWRWLPGVNEAVYAAVAADHAAHCAPEITMGAVTEPVELNRLAATFGKLNGVPDLSAFGYGQPRARVCKINEIEFLHLVYYHAAQPPLSIFARPHSPRLIGAQLTSLQRDSYSVTSVAQGGVDLLLVAALDKQQTTAITRALAARLE